MKYGLASLLLLALCSCKTSYPVEDYELFYDRQPKSILVLPVFNETTSAEAPAAFQSTIGRPLINRGYYILPVLPTIDILRAEGVFEGEQLKNVPPIRFKETLGADAVLYVTIHSWDTTYLVLASGVEVSMTYELIDTESGETMWRDNARRSIQSDSSGGLLAALVNAAVTALNVKYVDLARKANSMALVGLPAGPMHPRFDVERERYLAIAAKQAKPDAQ
jgi:hypothetical protein